MKRWIGCLLSVSLIGCMQQESIVNEEKSLWHGEEVVKYALGDIIYQQKEADEKIQQAIQDNQYTFEEPLVLVNPYGLTPLSALCIFQTPQATSITVRINDRFQFLSESATMHAIPIYGLYDTKENSIVFIDENGNQHEEIIQTQQYSGNRLEVEISQREQLSDEVYVLSPNFVENCIYDKEGNLLWYIEGDYAGDIEYLENGHFTISDPHQGSNGVKINYSSFLEMDYLGKIYKQYITEYGYHHEIIFLENGDILTTGAKENSPFLEAVLFIFDGATGKTKYVVDFYEKLHEMAPEWVESLGNPFDFVLNSIDYDATTNDVLLSFRGIGVVTRMNLDSQEFRWMLGDPENLPEEFDKYLLEITDDTKYPYGEHSAFFTKEGNISFHNNDADQLHMESSLLADYLDHFSTNVVVEIDEEKRTAHTIWEYDAEKKEFSKVAGMLSFLENENALVTFGYSQTPNSYEHADKISINDTEYLNGVIVELSNAEEVLFRAKLKGLIYRTYKTKLFPEVMPNYEVKPYEKIDGSVSNVSKQSIVEDKEKLLQAQAFEGEVDVLINRLIVDREFELEDQVDVYFVQEDDTAYICTYKESQVMPRIFNSGRWGALIHLPQGRYKAYVKVNDNFYDTNTVFVFD